MTLSIKHAFHSAKSDGIDPTLVQPSNWNADLLATCATGVLLGRQSPSTGAVEEISISAFQAAIIAAVPAAPVTSVAGKTGVVTLQMADITNQRIGTAQIWVQSGSPSTPADGDIWVW